MEFVTTVPHFLPLLLVSFLVSEQTRNEVLLYRNGELWAGSVDEWGVFHPTPAQPPKPYDKYSGMTSGSRPREVIPNFGLIDHSVYEYRIETLVKGVILDRFDNFSFVPEMGAQVLPVGTLGEQESFPIYNLTNRGLAKSPHKKQLVASSESKEFGLTCVGFELVLYTNPVDDFIADQLSEPPWFARKFGDYLEFGKLSRRGDFLPEPGLPIVATTQLPRPFRLRRGIRQNIIYNSPTTRNGVEDVYEFRSGRLIRGKIHASGNFQPEVGSKVTPFRDYDPRKDLRIYNLPGILRPLPDLPKK
jgi:hypothetical protein